MPAHRVGRAALVAWAAAIGSGASHDAIRLNVYRASEHFRSFDRDGDGRITQLEMEGVRGAPLTLRQLEAWKRADSDADQQVSAEEFRNVTASCLGGCCSGTCEDCVQEMFSASGACHWCAASATCLHHVSPSCEVGINSVGQCWSATCPYQQGHFLGKRPAAVKAWVTHSLAHLALPLKPFPVYPRGMTGLFDLATGEPLAEASEGGKVEELVIVGAGDWGSGTCEARVVGRLMESENPDFSFHLGDIYYDGMPEEFDSNVLGKAPTEHQVGVHFPKGKLGTFLLNANHEMISGGQGLFENGFSYTGQKATYGAWLSDHWRIIALDSSYLGYEKLSNGARNVKSETDGPQTQEVVDWLVNVVKLGDPEDKRGIIIFTHDTPFDAWDRAYTATAKQLDAILPPGRSIIWFFGHAHLFAMYKKLRIRDGNFTSRFNMYARLVGNGGFPTNVMELEPKDGRSVLAYDARPYQTIPQDPLEPITIGFHGFFKWVITGKYVHTYYITAKCKRTGCDDGYDEDHGTVIATETFEVDPRSGELLHEVLHVHPELAQPKGGERGSHEEEGLRVERAHVYDVLPITSQCSAESPIKAQGLCMTT